MVAKLDVLQSGAESHPGLDQIDHGDLINLVDSDLRNIVVDNRIVLQGNDGELIGYNAIYESTFVNSWISQFAIDEVAGVKYFNMGEWSLLTNKLVDGVIIVDDVTNLPLWIIPSFIRPELTPNGAATLAYYANKAHQAKFIVDKYQQTQFINNFARRVSEIVDHEPDLQPGLTRFVPAEIYEKYDIVPEAMKAMMYIRDQLKRVEPDSPDFDRAEAIFKNHYRGKPVSTQDKEFIKYLTNGAFNFGDVAAPEATAAKQPVKQVSSFNPLDD